jgi:hypothetical protein
VSINRAPKGVPTGGQFVAAEHTEPSVSLAPAPTFREKVRNSAGRGFNAVGGFADFVESNHQRDMAEIRNNPIIWSDLLPKFMRRKSREAKAAEPEQESAEARNRRLANVFGDAARAAERMDSASSRMKDLSEDR